MEKTKKKSVFLHVDKKDKNHLMPDTKRKSSLFRNRSVWIHCVCVLVILILGVQLFMVSSHQGSLYLELDRWFIRAQEFKDLAGFDVIEPDHIHADWKFYVDNELVDLDNEEYYENNRILHMHPGANNSWVIHVHNKGATLRNYLESIDLQVNGDCFIFEGSEYCSDEKELQIYVNGELDKLAPDRKLEDLDKILITYVSVGDESGIPEQLASIGNFACVQSAKC